MRCAKCGHEVDPDSLECPYCASGAPPLRSGEHAESGDVPPPYRCPRCGSTDVTVIRRDFDPGCGCLGCLLFSWCGLLLGFLGADERIVCRSCGTVWHRGRGCQMFCAILLIVIAASIILGLLRM